MSELEIDSKVQEKEKQITVLMDVIDYYFKAIRSTIKTFNSLKELGEENKFKDDYIKLLDSQYKLISDWVSDSQIKKK